MAVFSPVLVGYVPRSFDSACGLAQDDNGGRRGALREEKTCHLNRAAVKDLETALLIRYTNPPPGPPKRD